MMQWSDPVCIASTPAISLPLPSQKTTTQLHLQPEHRFFATCSPGLEPVVAAELSSPPISASDVHIGSSGVSFSGSFRTAYNANLWLRCAVRVLVELSSSPLPQRRAHSKDPIYEFIRDSVDWKLLLALDGSVEYHRRVELERSGSNYTKRARSKPGIDNGTSKSTRRSFSSWKFRTFAVQTRARDCPQVNNSMVASVRAKDAICDAIRDTCNGFKPSPPQDGGAFADVPLFLSVYKGHACLYRDMSGVSLHRRGYRDAMHRASLNEAIAAGILTIAGWNQQISGFGNFNQSLSTYKTSLLDPMCGSGTFLIEAALMSCNRAPGLRRERWPFQSWHDFDEDLWSQCWQAAAASVVSPSKGLVLLGNDVHEGAISLFRKDAKTAGVENLLKVSCKDCEEYNPSATPDLVVVNPPWGTRLAMNSSEEPENVLPVWQSLGKFLKQKCNNADVYILSGNPSASRGLHMRSNKKWPITVGGLECKLLHYYVLPPKNTTECVQA